MCGGDPARDRMFLEPFRGDLPLFLSAWDVAVLPSLFEGLPRSVLEAMAAGLPIVASRVDGLVEAVPPEAGILVEAGSAESLREGIRALAADPDRRRAMGIFARRWVLGRYSVDRMAADVEAVYRGLLQ